MAMLSKDSKQTTKMRALQAEPTGSHGQSRTEIDPNKTKKQANSNGRDKPKIQTR